MGKVHEKALRACGGRSGWTGRRLHPVWQAYRVFKGLSMLDSDFREFCCSSSVEACACQERGGWSV